MSDPRALARLADLHAQLAEAYRALAADGAAPAPPPAPKPPRPRRRVPPPPPVPDVALTEIDRARARRALRAAGYKVKP